MKKLLVMSVGGSPAPLRTAIRAHKPDYTVFVCSRASAKMVDEIVQAPGVHAGVFEIMEIDRFDDVNEVFSQVVEKIERLMSEKPDHRIVVDYTGGTKTMSAGLVLAASQYESIQLSVVTGVRPDLHRVLDGAEHVDVNYLGKARAEIAYRRAAALVSSYEYGAAGIMLNESAANLSDLPDNVKAKLDLSINSCRVFDMWDHFDHAGARKLMDGTVRKYYVPWAKFLDRINKILDVKGISPGETPQGTHGYELVEDLLLNADRCAIRQRFDDAVARVYRAMELFAHTRLRLRWRVEPSQIDLHALNEDAREWIRSTMGQEGPYRTGLMNSWQLLAQLRDELTSEMFTREKGRVRDLLEVRNHSILAHGVNPVGETSWLNIQRALGGILLQLLEEVRRGKPPLDQFPTDFESCFVAGEAGNR